MSEAYTDAKNILSEIEDEIVDAILEGADVEDFIWQNDTVQEGIHNEAENTAAGLRPRDAIEILEEYDDYEETDSGLWEGIEGWQEQLAAVAFWTYRNAISGDVNSLASELSEIDLSEIEDEVIQDLEAEYAELEVEDVTELEEYDNILRKRVMSEVQTIIG